MSIQTTTEIRRFEIDVSDDELTDLRSRINATRWPERETVDDPSQGVQLETIQALARYWATDYDWRKFEEQLRRIAAFRHRDRRGGHPLHSRSLRA